MYIKLLFMLILGYVRIEIEGYYIERFINICTNKKILIWNLKREKGVKLYLNTGIKDFKKIAEIARKTNCRVRILKKQGIPFLLNRYKKRKIFAIFLIIMLLSLYISSKYIWRVEIVIEENKKIENIKEDLEKIGIKDGILKSKINTEKVINEIRLKRNDIAWIGIDIEGTTVKVKIAKADEPPEIISNTDYCNIIASKPGIITKITAQNGTAKVNVGDEVQKGDILIAGYMEGKYTDTRYVHSLGEVEAKVFYEQTKEELLKEDVNIETGNIEHKYEILLNDWNIKLYNNLTKYRDYKKEEKNIGSKIFEKMHLPITIKQITNKEENIEHKIYTKEEAINKGTQKISQTIEEKIKNKDAIIQKKVKINESENSVFITVIYEVLEQIGENQKIQ